MIETLEIKNLHASVAKTLERFLSNILRFVAMNGASHKSILRKFLHHAVGAVFGIGKHKRVFNVLGAK